MRRPRRTSTLALMLALVILAPALAAAAPIAAGPDGSVWVAGDDTVLRRSPGGAFRLYRTPTALSSMVVASDGDLWGIESCGRVVSIDADSGRIRPYPSTARTPFTGNECFGGWITRGPGGDIWFDTAGAIGRIDRREPAAPQGCRSITSRIVNGRRALDCGAFHEWILAPEIAAGVAAGSDGGIWFSLLAQTGPFLARMDPVTLELTTPARLPGLVRLTSAADGALWFVALVGNDLRLGRADVAGGITWPSLGTRSPVDVAAGPGRAVSVACSPRGSEEPDAICRVDTNTLAVHVIRQGFVNRSGTVAESIAVDGAGATWVTDDPVFASLTAGIPYMVRIGLDGVAQPVPAHPVRVHARQRGQAVRVRMTCPRASAGSCRGRIELAGPLPSSAGSRGFVLAPGATASYIVRLSRGIRGLLRGGRPVEIMVYTDRAIAGGRRLPAPSTVTHVTLRGTPGAAR